MAYSGPPGSHQEFIGFLVCSCLLQMMRALRHSHERHGCIYQGWVLQSWQVCWCPMDSQCTAAHEFQGFGGKVSLRCPQNFYWPTTSGGSPEKFGTCTPCADFQKTAGSGTIGKDACLCRTAEDQWAFQEIQNGNCGCRDSYFWNSVDRICQKCTEGEMCQWNNDFSLSLEVPLLKPGFWAEPASTSFRGHSVYRCFSTETCPSNSSECAKGRFGKACSLCRPGYYGSYDGECSSCGTTSPSESRWYFAAIAFPAALCLSLLALVVFRRSSHNYTSLQHLKMALSQNFRFMQLVNVVPKQKNHLPLVDFQFFTLRYILLRICQNSLAVKSEKAI